MKKKFIMVYFLVFLFFLNFCIFARTIVFSGHTWHVKSSLNSKVGPGPNYFSDAIEDVWVDGEGKLHLKIVFRDNKWYCTEVYNQVSLGYGEYIFYIEGRIDLLDKNIILGLFTWDNFAPEYNYREIDIEFSKWGINNNQNSQYVVQPYTKPENIYRFNTILYDTKSTHKFRWEKDKITFMSIYGHKANPDSQTDIINYWVYTGMDNPPPGQEKIDINFWLMNGNPPSDLNSAEIVINKFEFIPVNLLLTPTPVSTSDIFDETKNYYIKNIKITPNPIKKRKSLLIEFDKKGYKKVNLKIFNIYGEMIKEMSSEKNKFYWNLATDENYYVSSGIYLFLFEGIDIYGNITKETFCKVGVLQ